MVRGTCAFLSLVLLAGCATAPPTPRAPASSPLTATEVQDVLAAQTAAWNRGDLEGFMATYWRDPALTFVGSRGVVHGWEPVLAGYRRGYPDADARGTLAFELLEVRPMGSAHALALGRFEIKGKAPASGFFSLILECRPEGVRIVHDHTSAATAR